MSVSEADLAFARELFGSLGRITHRRMMGGAVFYCDGVLFALSDGEGGLYLRTKGALADRLRAEGAQDWQWVRPKDGRVLTMGYVSLPEAALDDPERACEWAAEALRESAG